MSDSEADDEFLDIEAEAEQAIANLLPEKSKKKYEQTYKAFKDWCLKKKVDEVNENVILVYFTKELSHLKSPTAWSIYSMLRATLNIKENIEINTYQKLRSYLKKKNKGYHPKQSAILSKEQIYQFVNDAPDEKYLAMKVMLIIGVFGSCRRVELKDMSLDHMIFSDNPNGVLITLPKTKTDVIRQFVIGEGDRDNINLINIVKKYAALRPVDTDLERFFFGLSCREVCSSAHWDSCDWRVSEDYRKILEIGESKYVYGTLLSGVSLMAESGATLADMRRHCGWMNESMAERYIELSVANKRKIAGHILGVRPTSTVTSSNGTVESTDSVSEMNAPRTVESVVAVNSVNALQTVESVVPVDSVNALRTVVPVNSVGASVVATDLVTVSAVGGSNRTVTIVQSQSQTVASNFVESTSSPRSYLEIKVLTNCTINIYQNQ